jgi:hypothetical protein
MSQRPQQFAQGVIDLTRQVILSGKTLRKQNNGRENAKFVK